MTVKFNTPIWTLNTKWGSAFHPLDTDTDLIYLSYLHRKGKLSHPLSQFKTLEIFLNELCHIGTAAEIHQQSSSHHIRLWNT